MATISYTVSASVGTATSKCTLTATYSVSNSNDRTTITVSKLVAGSRSTTGGANNSQKTASINSLIQKMSDLVIALTFDGQTVATRTGATAGSTYTSYTGSKYVTKTHSAQTKTLKFVSTTASISVPAKPSYNVTYNANSGSGAPAAQTKWYGEDLYLSGTAPKKTGYTFKGWASSEANAKAGTVAYASGAKYTGNAGLSLWAVWELTYSKPAITAVSAERCDANGNSDDEGAYAKVNFNWSVFTSSLARYYGGNTYPYADNTISSASVTVGTYTETFTASDTLPIIVGGDLSTDMQYDVLITITDSQSVVADHTTTVAGTLSTSFFPIDFNADGTAMGIFRPAPDNAEGVYLGKDLFLPLDTTATSGTDFEIYDALVSLGWTDVIV